MSTIDPKWIQYDDTKLTTVVNVDGDNELTIRNDIVLDGVGVEFINNGKIEVRNLNEGEPVDVSDTRDMSKDIYIETPNL